MAGDVQTFTDALTKAYVDSGLPHSTAKVLVHLTVCNPPKQTAPDIQKTLALSAGSVSAALNLLQGTGLVRRSKLPGDRRYYYELGSQSWQRSMNQRLAIIDHLVELARYGTTLMPHNARLSSMYDVYQFFGDEFKGVMTRFDQKQQKKDAT